MLVPLEHIVQLVAPQGVTQVTHPVLGVVVALDVG